MEVLFRRARHATLGFCAAVLLWNPAAGQNQRTNAASPISSTTLVARAHSPARAVSLDDRHRLRAGDKVSFRIDEDREEGKILTVTDSGELELPFNYGRFPAAGKTCRQLAEEIKIALERDYFQRATVRLGLDTLNTIRGKANVSGQNTVARPGPINIPVDAPLKLSQAILLAGPTQWAKLSAVKVVRESGGETKTIVVDVDAILNRGRIEQDLVLEPGDLVIVPERGIVFGK